jgi:hypothetical protein
MQARAAAATTDSYCTGSKTKKKKKNSKPSISRWKTPHECWIKLSDRATVGYGPSYSFQRSSQTAENM